MAETKEKPEDLDVVESQDGSATVDLPEGLLDSDDGDGEVGIQVSKNDTDDASHDDEPSPGDSADLQEAKRNRRRAKKELIRKTNQEKDVRLQALQRENEEFRRRLSQLERNTKAEHITRLDKNIEDAQVSLEYAKMKLAEATSNNDGQGMVEAQTLWQNAQEKVKQLQGMRYQADQELRNVGQTDSRVENYAKRWVSRNDWYDPNLGDPDSRLAKRLDEQLVQEGWNPAHQEYWEEFDKRLQRELPHRYNDSNDDDSRHVRRPRNVVGSSGREASAAYGGVNRTQFVLSPDRVKAMKEAGAWDNPERKARMIKNFIAFDRANGRN